MSIADMIKKASQPTQAPVNNTQNLMQTAQQQSTGKAGTTSRVSNIQEQLAQSQAASKLQQQSALGTAQAGQLEQQQGDVTAKLDQARNEINTQREMGDQARAAQTQMADTARQAQQDESFVKLSADETLKVNQMANQYQQRLGQIQSESKMQIADIWANFGRSNQELESRKDAVKLEQLATDMRLSDAQYLDTLERVGKVRGLQEEGGFKKEAMRISLGEKEKLLKSNLAWAEAYDKTDRDFSRAMAEMSIDDAIAVANANAKNAAIVSTITGATNAATSYMNYSDDEDVGEATAPEAKTPEGYEVGGSNTIKLSPRSAI